MKKKLFLTAILTLLCCTLLVIGASADITPERPAQVNGVYQIGTAEELYWFAGLVNGTLGDGTSKDTAANAVLTADITINSDIDDPTYNWTPIGDDNNNYYGTFDGAGHTISGLYCSISSGSVNVYAGLFGYIGSGGTVKNVKVDGTVSACKNAGVGGVSGYNRGTINNCSFSGNVNVTSNGDKYVLCAVGGVCGYNVFGTITNCCNTGNVSVTNTNSGSTYVYAGGVCGINDDSVITNCYNTGNVSGDSGAYVGGVCGVNTKASITNCYNTGTVSSGECVGGVCGGNYGTITNCGFSGSGSVSGTGDGNIYVGGVCGVNQGVIKECYNNGTIKTEVGYAIGIAAGGVCGYNVGGTIENCYNTGTVTGYYAGGVCGDNRGTIENCYNTGTVTGYYVGGVCGYNNGGTITNCYWLKEEGKPSSGIGSGNADGATIKSTEQFASGEVTWLLNHGQNNGPWRQNLGEDDYPVLDSNRGEVVKLTVDGAVSYHNSPYVFEGVDGKTYFDETGKRIDLPYTVKKDTILTSKTLVTVTADSFDLFVGDAAPTLTCTISPAVEMEGIELKCDANMYTPGVYPITVTGPASDDLHVYTYVPGKLTVRNSWIVTVDGEVNYVKPGDTFKMPPAPSKPGYIFMGWSDGKTTWQPNDTVDITSDLTIKSVWANMPDITPTEPDEGLPFTDVPEGAWYYEAVKQVYEAGLMNGVTDTLFDPDGTLTRAMFWTILARASGVDTDGGATWYAVAQQWAVENGVSDGTDAMGALTREQLVTMLWRLNGEPVVNYLITTPDANQISPWALEAMKWAASTGLIEGDENGNLTPTATCTRAQAATFLVRYLTTE